MTLNDYRQIRLGVIGVGSFGMLHAETVDRLAECQLVAVVDPNPLTLAKASQRFPNALPFDKLPIALKEARVDGWIIASSTDSHIPIASQILSAGGRVLVEKPLASSLREAESLNALVKLDSSNLMMGHVVLFGSEFRTLLRELQNRRSIRYIDAVRHRPSTTLTAYPDESPFYLTMVHDLYCVQVLMQREEPKTMSAQVIKNASGQAYLACAQLQWSDGAIASLTASFLTPPGMPSDGFDRLEVFGGEWACRIESNPRPMQIWDDRLRNPITLEIVHNNDFVSGMLAEEIRCFCQVLRGESSVPIGATYKDALQIQSWLETLSSIAQV